MISWSYGSSCRTFLKTDWLRTPLSLMFCLMMWWALSTVVKGWAVMCCLISWFEMCGVSPFSLIWSFCLLCCCLGVLTYLRDRAEKACKGGYSFKILRTECLVWGSSYSDSHWFDSFIAMGLLWPWVYGLSVNMGFWISQTSRVGRFRLDIIDC